MEHHVSYITTIENTVKQKNKKHKINKKKTEEKQTNKQNRTRASFVAN